MSNKKATKITAKKHACICDTTVQVPVDQETIDTLVGMALRQSLNDRYVSDGAAITRGDVKRWLVTAGWWAFSGLVAVAIAASVSS